MCGIFGYIGKKETNATSTVLAGLKILEYRGYDSWGIAARIKSKKNDPIFVIEKHVGKIGNASLRSDLEVPSSLVIGHTRWATHGGVTQNNAHPHSDCTKKIALVHNGIVENFQQLREVLTEKGHTFLSKTDSEVIVHLIEEELKKKDFATAVRDAFNQLQGMNAIVVAYAPTQELIAAKSGSPLVVGIHKDEYFIASDTTGLIKYTNKILFVEDNQMVILNNDLKLIKLLDGKTIKPQITTIDWTFTDSEKGHFPHFLLKEIFDQPQVIEKTAKNAQASTKLLAKQVNSAYGTFMVGCGTASYAALAGTYLFSRIAKHHVNFSIGSEFNYLEDYLTNKSLIIPISQSGETIDVVDPVGKAKQKGARIAAIVNVIGSTLYRQADDRILLEAGQEKAVVATKSFMAMTSTLILTAYTLAGKQQHGVKLLEGASKNIQALLHEDLLQKIKNLAENLKGHEHIYLLGRGLSYATALEGALKIKETAYVHAEGFAGGELKHGVIALVTKGTPCFIFAPEDETYDEIISNAQEVKVRGGYIIGIGSKDNSVFDVFFKTENLEDATMLPQVLIMQLFGYYLALARGIADPDKPRNLAKAVTVK